MLLQIVGQGLLDTPVGSADRQVADDQAGGEVGAGLEVLRIAAGVADVGIGEGDNLTAVGRVGQDFLVTGHGRVEHHFTADGALGTDGVTAEHGAVGQGKQGGRKGRKQGHKRLRAANSWYS